MRIISQEGLKEYYDIPYEQVALQRFGSEIFFLNTNLAGYGISDDILIAKYSTEKKAKKVMEMLRSTYLGNILLKNAIPSDIDMTKIRESIEKQAATVITCYDKCNDAKIEQLNTIFVFPKDDEVEE